MTKNKSITFEQIRQVFSENLSIPETNAKIPTFELVTCVVFHFFSPQKNLFQ